MPWEQLQMFDVRGEVLRDEAIAEHQRRRGAELDQLRAALADLYTKRAATGLRFPSQSGSPYVTADDAHALAQSMGLGSGARSWNWLGAVFRGRDWRWTGDVLESTRASNRARLVRCWRWRGHDATA